MKKTFFISLLFLLLIVPVLVFAGGTNCPTEGLVPCGTDSCPCEICDLFIMFDRILDELFLAIIPVLAALMIVIGGSYYIISQGSPEKLNKAKSLFVSVAIGLLIIYGAWFLINMFLMTLGVTAWDGFGEEWWKIECSSSPTTIPTPGNNPIIPTPGDSPIIPADSFCSQCPGNEIDFCQRFICMSLGDCIFTPGVATSDMGKCSER